MIMRFIILLVVALGIAFLACQSAEMTSAKVYIQQKDYPAALEQLKKAAKNEPDNADVFLTMGKLYAEMDSLDEMSEAFDTALELDSTMAEDIDVWRTEKRAVYFERGIEYGKQEKWERAIERTRTAVSVDPTFIDGWINLAYFYDQVEDMANSYSAYRKAYELDPLNLEYAKTVAVREFSSGNAGEAEEILGKVIEEGEPDVDIYLLQSRVYMQQGKTGEAEGVLNKAMEEFPDNPDVFFDYATLLFSGKQDYEAAAEYFQKVVDLDPNNTDALYNLTVALYKAEKYEESAARGEKLVANDPQYTLGWVQFTISLKRMGASEKGSAAEKVAKALELMDKGEYSQAVEKLEPVTEKYPKWCAPWVVLKVAYNEVDNPAGAEKAQAGLDACGE